MKQCTKCGVLKDENDFSKNSEYADGLSYWCRECWKTYRKSYRDENIEEAREYTNNDRVERITWFQKLKENIPCVDCGKVHDSCCMDYDHVPGRGDKIKNVSRMVLDHAPRESILDEIKKCELICLLCHNIRTQKRLNEEHPNKKYPLHVLRNIDIINKAKNIPCAICGIAYDICNMQFDHIDSNRKFKNVSQLKSFKVATLLIEIEKCQVICALCHRKKSIIEQQADIYPESRPKIPAKPILFRDDVAQQKECSYCHVTKNFVNFSKQQKTKDGLTTACRECLSIAKKKKRGTFEENPLPSDQKECTQCEIVKHESEFSKRMDGGLNSWCKECFNEYRREKGKTTTTTA